MITLSCFYCNIFISKYIWSAFFLNGEKLNDSFLNKSCARDTNGKRLIEKRRNSSSFCWSSVPLFSVRPHSPLPPLNNKNYTTTTLCNVLSILAIGDTWSELFAKYCYFWLSISDVAKTARGGEGVIVVLLACDMYGSGFLCSFINDFLLNREK